MIEISLGKLVLLALIALIVLGPEKLPGAARTAGALLRRVRSGWDNVRSEVERELEIDQIKRHAREAAARAEALQNELKEGVQNVKAPLDASASEIAALVKSDAPLMTGLPLSKSDPVDGLQSELPLGEPPAVIPPAGGLPHDNA